MEKLLGKDYGIMCHLFFKGIPLIGIQLNLNLVLARRRAMVLEMR